MNDLYIAVQNQITEMFGEGIALLNEPMTKHTCFKIGGPADLMIRPQTQEQLVTALKLLKGQNLPYFVMGNGSNLLVGDKGYRGVIIKIADAFDYVTFNEQEVIAGGGILLSSLSKKIQENCLTGFEFASGIPGTVGGGVFMNAGAYDGEMKDIVNWVKTVDSNGDVRTYANEEMDFSYRRSRLYDTQEIVIECSFKLNVGKYEDIKAKTDDLTQKRTSKQPLHLPSAGSTFKRPEGYFAGKLIDDAGLRGVRYGGAQVSELHSGFVVNIDNATCKDVQMLIKMIQKVILDQNGVLLETEVRFIGEN